MLNNITTVDMFLLREKKMATLSDFYHVFIIGTYCGHRLLVMQTHKVFKVPGSRKLIRMETPTKDLTIYMKNNLSFYC